MPFSAFHQLTYDSIKTTGKSPLDSSKYSSMKLSTWIVFTFHLWCQMLSGGHLWHYSTPTVIANFTMEFSLKVILNTMCSNAN